MSIEELQSQPSAAATASVTTIYPTVGTCSKAIEVTTRNGLVEQVRFHGGCAGNTRGIEQLVAGMSVDDVIRKLRGTQCGARGTSCPDQLARALEANKQQAATHGSSSSMLRGMLAMLIALLTFSSCAESFEERCQREAIDFTAKQCPRAIDSDKAIIMDSMTYEQHVPGFTYHYHVTGDLDQPQLYTAQVMQTFHAQMLTTLQQNIALRPYKERGMSFTYRYLSGSTHEVYAEVVLTPDDYQ